MANAQGLIARVAAYAIAGGAESNHFALGFTQAGRFGESNAERDPEWSVAQREAYNQGFQGRREDDAALANMAPAP
jgi:hypothetical protein